MCLLFNEMCTQRFFSFLCCVEDCLSVFEEVFCFLNLAVCFLVGECFLESVGDFLEESKAFFDFGWGSDDSAAVPHDFSDFFTSFLGCVN